MDNVLLVFVNVSLNGLERTVLEAFAQFSVVAMETMVVGNVTAIRAGKGMSVMSIKMNVRFETVVVMEIVWQVFANVRQDGVANIVIQVSLSCLCMQLCDNNYNFSK